MTSDARPRRYLYAGPLLAIGLGVAGALSGCGAGGDPSHSESELQPGAPPPDAGDKTFIVRASQALLARSPQSSAEAQEFLAAMGSQADSVKQRRASLLDFLMNRPEFVRHWRSILYDMFRVARRPSSGRISESCWGLSVGAPTELAGHIATSPPSASATTENFTMLDVIETSLRADDLRPPFRGNLFAQMVTPLQGNQITEPNRRADYWTRFESAYLNRQQLCLGCHNTAFSVSGSPSDWNRHAPLPHTVELATFGSNNALFVAPPDLHADFRWEGFQGFGSEQPWGMTTSCGVFTLSPTPNTCPDPPPPPLSNEAASDVCFDPPEGGPRRVPTPKFGGEIETDRQGVFRLDQLFALGTSGLQALTDLGENDPERVREVPGDDTSRGPHAFGILVAANFAERVWEEVFGHRLTLANHFPRVPAQRNVLFRLAMDLVKPPLTGQPWSLRFMLKSMMLRPEFNAAAGRKSGSSVTLDDQYPMDILFNPWVLHDPRPQPVEAERCSSATPTFHGCIRGLLVRYRCTGCHENPDVFPLFNRDDYQSFASLTADQAFCEAFRDHAPCGLGSIDCTAIADKPGSRALLRVACDDPGIRMPLGLAPLTDDDRQAFFRWITDNAGAEGTPLAYIPAPDVSFVRNGVGDMVAWKSPYQLTFGMGSALNLNVWESPLFSFTPYPTEEIAGTAGHYLDDTVLGGRGFSMLDLLAWEVEHTTDQGPCRFGSEADRISALVANGDTVEAAVRELKLSFMGESDLAMGGAAGCNVDDPPEACERSLLEAVLGVGLSQRINPGNRTNVESGLRNACNVFMKSPLFVLSYVEPRAQRRMHPPRPHGHHRRHRHPHGHGRPHGHAGPGPHPYSDEESADDTDYAEDGSDGDGSGQLAAADPPTDMQALWPALCGGRLDCRVNTPMLRSSLESCWVDRGYAAREAYRVRHRIESVLADLRLSVARPEVDLTRALEDMPAALPTPHDPRIKSNVLMLPLEGGRVLSVRGELRAYLDGRWRQLRPGSIVAYGETLFIPAGTQFKIQANAQIFDTGSSGMPTPPELQTAGTGGSPVWIVIANGNSAKAAPPPARDARIDIGSPLDDLPPVPMRKSLPVWADFGEAGLTYRRP